MSDIEEIETQRAALSAQIGGLLSKMAEIGRAIGEVEKAKREAKSNYSSALDAGDEQSMSRCLSAIRQANSQHQELIASLAGFDEKIVEFRRAHAMVLGKARSIRSEADQELEAARSRLEDAEQFAHRCSGRKAASKRVTEFVFAGGHRDSLGC